MNGQEQPGAKIGETSLREEAEKRVKRRMELIQHLAAYVIVNGLLILIWALTGRGYPWFLWVVAGWGIGIIFHLLDYFVWSKVADRKGAAIDREMERMKRSGK